MATGEKWREWYRANKAHYHAYQVEWRRQKRLREKGPPQPPLSPEERHRRKLERTRKWRAANPLYVQAGHAAMNANKRAARLGLPDRLTPQDVATLWQRQPVCAECSSGRGIDHIVGMRHGGANRPENLQNLCASCNSRKENARRRG